MNTVYSQTQIHELHHLNVEKVEPSIHTYKPEFQESMH